MLNLTVEFKGKKYVCVAHIKHPYVTIFIGLDPLNIDELVRWPDNPIKPLYLWNGDAGATQPLPVEAIEALREFCRNANAR